MGLNEDILADVAAIKASNLKIRADIAKLSAGIPAGGLTADEAANLKSELDKLVTDAADIDALTPEDPAPVA